MIDIKPDTSLYTDLPSRLRAMALVLEGPQGRVQSRKSKTWPGGSPGEWGEGPPIHLGEMETGRADYRLKPTPPAKLYVDITDDGRVAHAYGDPRVPQMPGTTRVIYVLENPDAND